MIPNPVYLSRSTTITGYRSLEMTKDQSALAEFIYKRHPITSQDPANKHGFSIMAVCCLMMEALESFHQGLEDTRGQGKEIFEKFFERNTSHFPDFVADAFYTNVRCGIHHQAETKGGWTIGRKGPLLNDKNINATKFLTQMEAVLSKYRNDLKKADWDSELWCNFRKKMDSVIVNCEA